MADLCHLLSTWLIIGHSDNAVLVGHDRTQCYGGTCAGVTDGAVIRPDWHNWDPSVTFSHNEWAHSDSPARMTSDIG